VIGAPIAEYDGIAELWVDSMEDWQEVISDPEFIAFATGTLIMPMVQSFGAAY